VRAGPAAAHQALRSSLVCAAHERFVRLTGRVPHAEVPRYVAAMDVAVIADAGFYQSPLKLLEYMAAGRAIVAPRHEAIEEVAGHRRHALLFEPGSADDAIACLRQLLGDTELRRDLGTAARARVAGELTWRHNAARVVAACGRAITEKSHRRGAETRRRHVCEAE
jgi:glycosyltransferase involved in cell wall biosynthesis